MTLIINPLYNPPADKKSLYPYAIKHYHINWDAIRHDTIECQYKHLRNLSALNIDRLFNHRIRESPGLLSAHKVAFARCYSDKRLVFNLELTRQIRRLLKGPGRDEYRLRMVGSKGAAGRSRPRQRKTPVVGAAVELWKDRLRLGRKVEYRV